MFYTTLEIAAIVLLAALSTIPKILEIKKRKEVFTSSRENWINSVAVELARIQDCPCDKITVTWAKELAVEYFDGVENPVNPRIAAYKALE